MNILVISQYFYPEPFRIHEICEALVTKGHKVTVVTSLPNYPDGKIYEGYMDGHLKESVNGVNILRCKVHPRKHSLFSLIINYLSFYIQSNNVINSIKDTFDCVYSYQLSPITSSIPAYRYAKKQMIPSLVYCLDLWPVSMLCKVSSEKTLIYKIITKISSKVYNSFSKIIVSSPSFSEYIGKLCGMDKSLIRYIPQHSKDIEHCQSKDYLNTINFVFIGNVGDSQNVQCFIKACSQIEETSGLKIHIVGSGSKIEEVMHLAKQLNVENLVVFHGRQPKDRMPYYYAFADVCLLSLRDEGDVSYTIPGKLQEYMAAGKAVLASVKGDASIIINEANCGICVGIDDINAIVKAIDKMRANKLIIKEFGKNAKSYYETHFTLDRHVNAIEAELLALLS